uniref:F-box domain-containing protein n=1 Tax=Strongyloides venezuelensis TaxID=75913 RepID=A0A0K0FZF2_STRVS
MHLPNEVIKLILKNVDWRTLYKVKLVSKFFDTLVNSNLDFFQKPKMKMLNMSSFYNKEDTLEIYCSFFCEDKFINLERFSILIDEIKVDDIEYYLKKVNLFDIEYVWVKTNGKTIVFDILNRYFKPGTSVQSLHIEVNNNPDFQSFSQFIQKIRYVNSLYLKNLCFTDKNIPKNYELSMIEKLSNLFLLECRCTCLVNSLMIKNLFINNKSLKEVKIYSKCSNFEVDLVRNIKARQDLCNKDEKSHEKYHIYLPHKNGIINNVEFIKYFPCGTYSMLDTIENYCTFGATKACQKCSTSKAIFFTYIMPPKPIGIDCESTI